MSRTKIAFLGAGSVVFSRNVIADILWHDALKDCEVALMDIDAERLQTAAGMAGTLNRQLGGGARISASTVRRAALDGADFVISAIGVGGMAATRVDLNLPERFGVIQTVGDTLGVGGVFRAVRSVPVLLDICRDIEALCPRALLLNYSNPVPMHCLAVERATRVRHVGLCHGVQGTAQHMRLLTLLMAEPRAKLHRHFQRAPKDPVRIGEWLAWWEQSFDPHLRYLMAGINHMAFALRFESKGKDLYPLLRKAAEVPEIWRFDPVRFEMLKRIGYFMTETSRHTAEYVPYFLKDASEMRRHFLAPKSYLDTCRAQERQYRELRRKVGRGQPIVDMPYKPSIEYGARIINAVVTGERYQINGNVHNAGGRLISNLPGDCCVEVPCTVDRSGIHPIPVGDIPPQCAALIRTNVNVQDLAVRGIIEGDRRYIHQAIMLDPNTASCLTLREIDRLVDAMFKSHARRLPPNLR